MDAENRNGGNASDIESRFDSSLTNWSETAGTLEAGNGFSLGVSYNGTNTTGLRIHQDDPSRNFTDNSSDTDWEVVDNGRVRGIRFNVSRDNLSTTEPSAFTLDINDQGGVGNDVSVSMHANGSNVVVSVQNDTGPIGSCEVEPPSGDSLVVDVGSKMVGNRYCAPLEAAHDQIEGDVDIWFDNADNAAGTYELYVTNDDGDLFDLLDGSEFASVGSGYWPVQQDAIYDANVTFVFHSSGTTVEKEIRIAPGEL